jgi:hypothetical protein
MDCFTRDINCTYIQELTNFKYTFTKNRQSGYPGVTNSPGSPEKKYISDIPGLISMALYTKVGSQNGTCNDTQKTRPCQGPVYLFYIILGRNMHRGILLLRFSRLS